MADKPGLLGWFISNPIAANLLMVVLVIGGLYNIPGLDKQFFPTRYRSGQHRYAIPGRVPGSRRADCVRIEEAIMTSMALRKFGPLRLRAWVRSWWRR